MGWFTQNRSRWAVEAGFALLCVSSALPLFVAHYLPFQDLPQHAAAVRVLRDYGAPHLNFSEFFELSFGTSQYLLVYAVAWLLACVFDAVTSIKLVLGLSLVALPYSLRALLGELGKPRSYALLALPLAYNAHLVLGFVHFIAGLPLLLLGLACCVRICNSPSTAAKLMLAVISVLCFYTHVVPYGTLCLGAVLLALNRSPAKLFERLLPIGLSALCALWWLLSSPSGATVSRLVQALGSTTALEQGGLQRRILEVPVWLGEVFDGDADERLLCAWAALVLVPLLAGLRERSRDFSFRLFWLIPLAWAGYLILPAAYSFIWPINARFALIAMLLSICVLPRISRVRWRAALAVLASLVGLCTSANAARVILAADRVEYAGLERLIREVPHGSRVAGLMFAARSAYVRFAPYLHSVAWCQAERGGVVMFTFAEFPSSPFRFRENHRPPHVPERWEWLPTWVDTETELAFYEFALVRGGPAILPGFVLQKRHAAWTLWRRARSR